MARLLTARTVARMLSVRPSVLLEWVDAGEFPSPVMLPDSRERWRTEVVEGWIQTRQSEPIVRLRPSTAPAKSIQPLEVAPAKPIQPEDVGKGRLQTEILQVLREAGDAWVLGRDIASKIDANLEHTNGSFRRAIRALRKAKKILSNGTAGGYRIAPANSGH